jgi:hypothetical protein
MSRDAPGRGAEMRLPSWRPSRPWVVTALLAAGLLAIATLKLPVIARFEVFQFGDWGANLTVQALIDRGERPTIDFFYPYGLLPLMAGRAWFGLWGRTPAAYLGAVAACHVLTAWAVGRLVRALDLGWIGVMFLIAALPLTFPPTYPSLAHGLEAVLITHALASQAKGRRDHALALAGLAALAKPSMGYVYGALLLALIVLSHRGRAGSITRDLRPTVAVLGGTGLTLAAVFGPATLIGSLLPGATAELYKHAHYGFFRGNGRDFWLPPGAGLRHYVGTPRGYWLAATLLLLGGTATALVRLFAGRDDDDAGRRAAETVLTCATLHVAYACLFFGGADSWWYYAYLPALGAAALTGLGRPMCWGVAALILPALASDWTQRREIADAWRAADARNDGLWISTDSLSEWRAVLDQIDDRSAVLLAMSGCGELTYRDRFAPPVCIFLLQGMDDTIDVRRKAEQVRRAEVVVVPKVPAGTLAFRLGCPAFRAALVGKARTFDGRYYAVYRRVELALDGDPCYDARRAGTTGLVTED